MLLKYRCSQLTCSQSAVGIETRICRPKLFLILQVMAINISFSFWLAVLALVTQIDGDSWSQIQTDIGDYPDSNTAPLLADLNSGLNPDTIGPNGWTALHLAAGLKKPNMATVLKQKGANLNIQDSSSYTPLHLAAGVNSFKVISSLLPGADTEVKGPNQWTALHVATGNNFNDAIHALIKKNANPNVADSQGWTPLHIAVGTGHLTNVETLLGYFQEDLNINAQDNNGFTALHIAAGQNRADIVNTLLYYEASTTILDNNGHTAKQVAAFLGYTNIVNLIP